MAERVDQRNRAAFDDPAVVSDYKGNGVLWPQERAILERRVPHGARVLDLGVGTGRTTAFLLERASSYIGIDYAPRMIEAAQHLHPGVDLRVGDATDLSHFPSESLDVVVFSYNGLDYLHPVQQRLQCLQETARVLVRGGVVIFSTHSPRGVIHRPRHLLVPRDWIVAGYQTATSCARLARSSVLWSSGGYYHDPARGGLTTYSASRQRIKQELSVAGLDLLPDDPLAPTRWWRPWGYYGGRKP